MTFEHQGLIFRHDRWPDAMVTGTLRAALDADLYTVLAVSDERVDGLVSALSEDERARVRVVERERLYASPGRALASLHRLASSRSGDPVLVVAEPPSSPEGSLEAREWRRWESVLCTALAPARMRLVCVHDERSLSARERAAVIATHPMLVGADGPYPNPSYLGSAAFGARPAAPEPLAVKGPVHRLEIGPSLPRLRRELTALVEAAGLPLEQVERMVTAVNELAANVLEHGAGKGGVHVWRAADRWVCDVSDESGGPIDPLIGYRPSDDLRPRGYGLWITRQICDFLEISGGGEGSLVRLHFLDRRVEDLRFDDGRLFSP
ncbi:anti-sigma factor RsbA family regulatory protein [Nocardiopsis lambiniae]|uniref:Anti-sigma factor RsbA family regulatory protein n=1 Tax=Nocardiopsis lambiniae TaxID=3075539 RepID=A0ABU2MDH8_9ACTN|nr:anti-sigma factor RsbA family regulatory protein [Nocardiopsis sp. DSM 44743]MDT0330738.1 anti-sigma factor RsbA family regulatory protein [Nocardiopsis sp. DSM 44743]